MAILTLTTDYGTSDHYVAHLKGHLLRAYPGFNLVDVSHNIKSFDIVQAAFVLKQAYPPFAPGTIHLALVHNRTAEQDLVCVQRDGQYFMMLDNGMITLLFDEITTCHRLARPDHLGLKEWIARCAADLQAGKELDEIGQITENFQRRIHLKPVVTSTYIRGVAIYVDHYDNIIFNITRDLFESVCADRAFELFYKRHDPITVMHDNYYDVPVGETVCRFNNAGYLELGINMGRAASLLGIKVDDAVQIHFNE
ncbi:MAG: SAM-dependent chlorinase/fluorinase [Saprospiraceae bacterium]|nr:SAM-dependent chlorinase/fluorinase [Saprospiraceae bacterium]